MRKRLAARKDARRKWINRTIFAATIPSQRLFYIAFHRNFILRYAKKLWGKMRGKKDINNNLLKNSEKFVLKHKKILDQTYKNLWDEDKMDEMSREREAELAQK